MSVLSDEQIAALEKKVAEYDYIRFSWPDMNGILRGKTVTGKSAPGMIRDGLWEYTGTITFGPLTEIPNIQRIHDANHGNSNFVPGTDVIDLPWAGDGKYKVGQLICEAFWADGSAVTAAPRTVARKQFERLDALGYKLFSAFEAEFVVVDAITKEPVFSGLDFAVDSVFAENSVWLFDLEQNLKAAGIDVGAMHTEYSPGQFEFCMAAKYGMATLDNMMIFKQAAREVLAKHKKQPTFMTRPFVNNGGSSGFHFNHSLWNKDGKCLFYDASKPDNMSDVMRHWVGGLMKHTKALTALCCPTPNCYRRLHQPWAPDKTNWGLDDRFTSYRVKTIRESCCLVENRLPSSACNPYLAAAATIAAGLDGIENKLEPGPSGKHDDDVSIPGMSECLDALQSDVVLRKSLGEEFVEWFLIAKRENELAKFKDQKFGDNAADNQLEKEIDEYFKLI